MEKKDKYCSFVYAVIAALVFVGMLAYSGVQEFWYDEVYQLGLVGPDKGIGEVLRSYMQLKDYTPPLYAIIVWIWRAVIPFSFPWLLLISEGFTAAGIFFTALAGKELGVKNLDFWQRSFLRLLQCWFYMRDTNSVLTPCIFCRRLCWPMPWQNESAVQGRKEMFFW